MRAKFHLPGFIATLLLLGGSLLAASLGETVHAAPARNPGQDNVVISEFRSRGTSPGYEVFDDFVEIFNPTGSDIDIGGWYIKSVSSSGAYRAQFNFISGTLLSPGQHYLIAGNYYSGMVPPDGTFASGGIADNGGVALTASDGSIIDMAGMSPLAAEGTPLDLLTGNLDQSYERQPGGASGSCYDSNDNSIDFFLRSPRRPAKFDRPRPPTLFVRPPPGSPRQPLLPPVPPRTFIHPPGRTLPPPLPRRRAPPQ